MPINPLVSKHVIPEDQVKSISRSLDFKYQINLQLKVHGIINELDIADIVTYRNKQYQVSSLYMGTNANTDEKSGFVDLRFLRRL